MTGPRPRALLLDLGDTVFRLDPLPDLAEPLAARLAALDVPDPAAAARRMLGAFESAARASYERGDTIERPASELVLAEPGLAGSWMQDAAPALDDAIGEADVLRWLPPPGRAALLQELRQRGFRLVYVSNTLTAGERMRARLGELGLLEAAQGAVFSVELGVRKPGPAIYRAALALAGVDPAEALFIGDRVREDVEGPQAVGIPALLTHEFRQEEPRGAAVIRSLEALLSLPPP
ncbi:HAD family hydrolase [Tepidiforma sp.]|uniref:HAD family hydrolase n=1 Tax=Tepidiforma sp. TaxID=2682230 RepID=UPI002ADD5589|nr:HAD family hydrolase [Tepidiforma sp.]